MEYRAEAWYRRRTSDWRDWAVRRSLDLAVMAAELLAVAERRRAEAAGMIGEVTLEQFERADGQLLWRSRPVPIDERPPAHTVLAAGQARPVRTAR